MKKPNIVSKGDCKIKDSNTTSLILHKKKKEFNLKKETDKKVKELKDEINNPSGDVNCSVNCIHRIIDKVFGKELSE